MDYFNDVLATFPSLDRVRILAVCGRVRELLEFIKDILICVLKMNEGLTGLERHESEFHFKFQVIYNFKFQVIYKIFVFGLLGLIQPKLNKPTNFW